MNEQDLRDCFAMFAMNGYVINDKVFTSTEQIAVRAYALADAMLEQRKTHGENDEETNNGIAAVAPKRSRKR